MERTKGARSRRVLKRIRQVSQARDPWKTLTLLQWSDSHDAAPRMLR